METTLSTRTSSLKSTMLLSMTSDSPKPTIAGPRLAARSAITLYPPAGGDATSTLSDSASPTQAASPNQATQQTSSSSPTISPAAFWAVLGCLILLLVLLALAFPLWYCLRGRRHKTGPQSNPFSTPSTTNTNIPDGQQQQHPTQTTVTPISWLFPSLTNPQQQQGAPSPLTPHQQLQLLHHLTQSSPPQLQAKDPNRAALLARLATLNNPSILNGIPEDSTVLTPSSLHPRPPVVNSNYKIMAEKKLAELRAKGAVVGEDEEEDGTGGGGGEGEGGKKVRFRAQEWAVLGSEVDSLGVGSAQVRGGEGDGGK